MAQADHSIAPSGGITTSQDNEEMKISQTEAADIELEFNELISLDQQGLQLSDMLAESLDEELQGHTVADNNSRNE